MANQRTVDEALRLRAIVGEPKPLVRDKEMSALDGHCRAFIVLSSFLCIATMGADGRADVSPRGDPPGFVAVPDAHTLLIPERPGNRRAEVFFHCAKAFKRSGLGDAASRPARSAFPPFGRVVSEQRPLGIGADEAEALIQKEYRDEPYRSS